MKQTYKGNTICHVCKNEFVYEDGYRSLSWAFQMAGVFWLLCSNKCAEKLRDEANGAD